MNEMKENISEGIANTPDNLKTKLFAGGIEVTWKELMNMQKTGEYIDNFLDAGGSGTYNTYANIGIARAYVHKSGLGLAEDQVKVLSEAVEKKIDRSRATQVLMCMRKREIPRQGFRLFGMEHIRKKWISRQPPSYASTAPSTGCVLLWSSSFFVYS